MTKKIINHNGSISVEYKANVPFHTAPKIESVFTDDEGNDNYILLNGNTTLVEKYNALWGMPKGQIKPKNAPARGIDPRTNFY